MSIRESLARFLEPFAPMEMPETRSEFPSFDTQLAAVRRSAASPWRPVSVREAMSVPAVFRSVTLIANTVGALSLEAYRQGAKMPQPDAPRLVVRPNPLTTPREFFRETAYSMAAYGEAWWWIAARDADNLALSLVPMPAPEVNVTANEVQPLRPKIEWRGREMRNEDVIQVPFSRAPGDLRGSGPLQSCGAAVSVSVEAQEWAANFFAEGGVPSILIKSAFEVDEDEAKALKSQWVETPSNVPRVIDPRIEDVSDFGLDPAKAQLTESRRFERGEVAVMFGIPASLLDHSEPGASLTYQNVSLEYDKFVRACLWPGYLEPIEQALSDLLTRSTVARFNLAGLLRADIKTRYDVHKIAIETGVYGPDYAQQLEGIAPGDPETAPVPFASPAAVPTRLPIEGRAAATTEVTCAAVYAHRGRMVRCGRRLGTVAPGPYSLYCPRCKVDTEGVA